MTKAADGHKVRLICGTWHMLLFAGAVQVDAIPFPSFAEADAASKASPLPDIERAATGDRP